MTHGSPYRATVEAAPLAGHGGLPSRKPMVLFASAPPEIGPLRSAQSTLSAGAITLSRGVRIAAITFGALLGGTLFVGLAIVMGYDALFALSAGFGGLVFGAFAARAAVTLHHRVEYVGVDGVAVGDCHGTTHHLTWRVQRFADAAHVRSETTGAPPGAPLPATLVTTLTFCDPNGRDLLTLSDTTGGAFVWPWSSLTVAADVAWTRWRLARALAESDGRFPEFVFPMREGRLRVTADSLFLEASSGSGRFERAACSVAVEAGRLRLYTAASLSEPTQSSLDVAPSEVADVRLLQLTLSCATAADLAAAAAPLAAPPPTLHIAPAPAREPTNNRSALAAAALVPAVLMLVGVAVAVVAAVPRRQRMLVVDNPSLQAVAVTLDGATIANLAPRRHLRVDLTEGSHVISARRPDGRTESFAFRVPPRRHLADGWYGLWRAAGRASYARITASYGANGRTVVRSNSGDATFVALDDPELAETFDEPFPRTMRVSVGTTQSITRLCAVSQGMATGCQVE